MKKEVLIILGVLIVGGIFVGCSDIEKRETKSTSQSEESKMLSQSEKDSYKEKAAKALKGENVKSIDILTQNKTQKAIISVQVGLEELKDKVAKEEVEEVVSRIEKKLKSVSELYEITVVDKKNQLTAMVRSEDKGMLEFF